MQDANPQSHCADFRHGCSGFTFVHFDLVTHDKLLSSQSAEDDAMAGIGMRRVLVRLSMNVHVNPLQFIVRTPTLKKDFVILQLYWWLFSSTTYCC